MPVPCNHRSTPSTRRRSGTPSVSDGGKSFEGVRGLTPPLPILVGPRGGGLGLSPLGLTPPLLLGAQKVLWVPGPPYSPPPFSPVQEKSEEINMRSIMAKKGGNTRKIRKMKINKKKQKKPKIRKCEKMRGNANRTIPKGPPFREEWSKGGFEKIHGFQTPREGVSEKQAPDTCLPP